MNKIQFKTSTLRYLQIVYFNGLYNFVTSLMGCCVTSSTGIIPTTPLQTHPQKVRPEPNNHQQPSSTEPSNPQVKTQTNNFEVLPQSKNPQEVTSKPKILQQSKPRPKSPPQIAISAKDKKIAQEIMDSFEVSKLMKEKMDGVAYTSDQLESIVNSIVKTIIKLETCQSIEEKKTVGSLLEDINQELFYHRAVQKLKNIINTEAKPESLSRIYHGIANLKKKQKINAENQNELGIKEWKTNQYDKLSPQQVDQVVGYEAISQKIIELGTKLNYRFSTIEKDSNGIMTLLVQLSSRYQKDIQGLTYDLNPQEYKKVAEISRNASNYHDSGVVLLFIYFVRACKKLEQDKILVSEIQQKMEQAIQWINSKYPPGEGLDSGKKHLENALKGLQHQEKFAFKPSKLDSKEDKQVQLEKIILENAAVAKRSRDDFEELIRQACLKLAIQTKVGLKLNPDNPNKKAMIRIKEKMLFGKTKKLDKKAKESIQQTIEGEDQDYKQAIDQLLEEKDEVTFKISDMVRGKCVFLEVQDIILTLNQIKEFVKKDAKRRYRITEIESRFTNPQPISDITLKIAINEEVVSELQLTIQANAAAYNFSHKVYELARTKVFSKIKISHNYFQQFAGDFKAQVSKALDISMNESQAKVFSSSLSVSETKIDEKAGKDKISNFSEQSTTIRQFLDLESMQIPKNYEDIMQKSISEQTEKLTGLVISTDKKLQKLMLTLFKKQMGSWKQELGREMNQVLESGQNPPLLKATLLYYFFKSFDISKQVPDMLHFYPSYQAIAEKLGYDWEKQYSKGKNYMEIYLQQIFAIEKPFVHTRLTARLFYQALQTQQITIQKKYPDVPSLLEVDKYIKGVVMEENSPENIDFISQLVLSFFIVRGKQQKIVPQFDQYYRYLMSKLEIQPKLVPKIAGCSSEFLKAQELLEGKNFSEAQQVLEKILVIFKQNEEVDEQLQCQLLLAECKAHTCDFSTFQEYYAKNVVKKAEALGIDMRGVAVANAEWRIYQKLWSENMSAEQKQYVEKTHLKKAITESSRSEGEEWFLKMVKTNRNGNQIEQQCILENQTVNYINLSLSYYDIKVKQMQLLERSRWPKISTFVCFGKKVDDRGCEHLSRAGWKNLSTLNLGSNNIGDEGCQHLRQAAWKHLSFLELRSNNIGSEGCQHLCKAGWKYLSTLDLTSNNIGDKGCLHLGRAQFKHLSTLFLGSNNISDEGCQNLRKAKCKNLSTLYLGSNKIGSEGCKYLSKAQWKQLSNLYIWSNIIDAKGCENLSKADWKNLSVLDLNANKIDLKQIGKLEVMMKKMSPKISINWQ